MKERRKEGEWEGGVRLLYCFFFVLLQAFVIWFLFFVLVVMYFYV